MAKKRDVIRMTDAEIWPFIDGPPSTDLGREAAAWAAERGHP